MPKEQCNNSDAADFCLQCGLHGKRYPEHVVLSDLLRTRRLRYSRCHVLKLTCWCTSQPKTKSMHPLASWLSKFSGQHLGEWRPPADPAKAPVLNPETLNRRLRAAWC